MIIQSVKNEGGCPVNSFQTGHFAEIASNVYDRLEFLDPQR